MFGNRSFLVLGDSPADIQSLESGVYELLKCNFNKEKQKSKRRKVRHFV